MYAEKYQSKLRFYSIGIVANNKPLSSTKIQVTPIETLTMIDGEIASIPLPEEDAGIDHLDRPYTTKVTSDLAIEAEWYQFASTHRRTAPDVRRGERVIIWQYGDTDEYLWSSLGMDDRLRKLETIIWSFSDTTDEKKDSTDPKYCYSLEVSTHEGHITLRTVKENGEFCQYVIQLNTKEGKLLVTDDVGNEIELNSAETLISLLNASGTKVELKKSNIKMKAVNIEVEGKTVFKDPVTFKSAVTANGITSSAPIQGPSDTI